LDLVSSANVRVAFSPSPHYLFISAISNYDAICGIAMQILEQKASCQQDPDQDENEQAPEDQVEFDSVLISSAGDLVASLANALGAEFNQAFTTFFPLISKYYVRFTCSRSEIRVDERNFTEKKPLA
jgi:hypothetical protein